jgi:hypothetical protein
MPPLNGREIMLIALLFLSMTGWFLTLIHSGRLVRKLEALQEAYPWLFGPSITEEHWKEDDREA